MLHGNSIDESQFGEGLQQFFIVRALPCQPAWSSMKLTPLPLTVSARSRTGRRLTSLAGPRASTTSVMLWPSMRITSQPKLAYLAARFDLHNILDGAIDLQAVAVDDGNHVIQLVLASLHGGFPDLSLLLLAIAHDAEDLVLLAIEPCRQSHAHGDTQSLAQ